jgi:NAD/NADP transhydrogenase beta subunit
VISDPDVSGLLYLVTIVCFVVALRFLSSPKHAPSGRPSLSTESATGAFSSQGF